MSIRGVRHRVVNMGALQGGLHVLRVWRSANDVLAAAMQERRTVERRATPILAKEPRRRPGQAHGSLAIGTGVDS